MWTYALLLLTAGTPVLAGSAASPSSGEMVISNTPLSEQDRTEAAIEHLLPALAYRWEELSDDDPSVDTQLEALLETSTPLAIRLVERRLEELDVRRRAAEAAQLSPVMTFAPRKRNIDPDMPRLLSRQAIDEEWIEIRAMERAYTRLLGLLGDQAHRQQRHTAAFRAYAAAIVLDPEHWNANAPDREAYCREASTFMIISAHRSEDVLTLYRQVSLDRRALNRQLIAEMERWLNVYLNAPGQLADYSGIQKALGDILYVLIEDPAAIAMLPEQERRRLLGRLAKAALDRGHYAEAIGAYARLGDDDMLKRIGGKLSRKVVVETSSTLLVQREVSLAIDALAEAGDTEGLLRLQQACAKAEIRVSRGDKPVVNREALALFMKQLAAHIGQGDADMSIFAPQLATRTARTSPPQKRQEIDSPKRLKELISFYVQTAEGSLSPAEQQKSWKELKLLEIQAEKQGLLVLAIEAAAAQPRSGMRLINLGRRAEEQRAWPVALSAYRDAGTQGISSLRKLGDRLAKGQAVLINGTFNTSIEVAVNAYLAADAVDRLEPVYNGLRQARNDAILSGAKTTQAFDPSQSPFPELHDLLQRIERSYEPVSDDGPALVQRLTDPGVISEDSALESIQ